jgi:putative membrane protein
MRASAPPPFSGICYRTEQKYRHFHFFGGGWMMIFWWILIIAVIVIVIRVMMQSGKKQSKSQDESPLEILKRRYAKGEITKEEYEERKKDLKS